MLDASMTMTVASVFSIAGTSAIILSYVLFPSLRQLRYVELVFYVAVNDFVGAIGTSLGYNDSGSFACWFQGVVTSYNFLVAVFWTVVIAYQLFLIIVRRGRYIEDLTNYHLVCWLFPLLVTFLPLSTNTYGEADDAPGWCFIANRAGSPSWGIVVWEILSFYLWLWLAIIVIVVLFIWMAIRLHLELALTDMMARGLYRLGLYPVVFIVCWALDTFMYIDAGVGTRNSHSSIRNYGETAEISGIMASLQGGFIALIFFSNGVVRKEWRAFLSGTTAARTTDLDLLFMKDASSLNQDFSNGSNSAYSASVGTTPRYLSRTDSNYPSSADGGAGIGRISGWRNTFDNQAHQQQQLTITEDIAYSSTPPILNRIDSTNPLTTDRMFSTSVDL